MGIAMEQARRSRGIFLVYTAFVAICSLILLTTIVLSPSEPGNAVLLGLSLARLVLAAGFAAASLFFGALFLQGLRDAAWAEKVFELCFGGGRFSRVLAWCAGLGLGLGWIGCFLPSYRAGPLEPHWERIQPVMVFLLLTSMATLAVFLVRRIDVSKAPRKASRELVLFLLLSLASLLVLGWMFSSKYGIYSPPEDFWYGAGVPILVSQLVLAVLGGVLFLLAGWNWNAGRKDLIVVLVLYAVTAVLWAREPLQRSFLFTEPRPPNGVLYPFADAAFYDAGSQFALIGQDIFAFNSLFFERTIYLSFLVYLHTLFGQNYEVIMAAQAAVLAVLPAILYLIGRSLDMRAVGFAAALVALFRGTNSIAASSLIDLANPKMLLTDFPSAIGMALIVLFTCEWIKRPGQKMHYAVWAGGAIGLTLMLRTNALLFLLFVPLYALFRFLPNWKSWLIGSLLLFFAAIAISIPWELRNAAQGGVMYSPIVTKIMNVIRDRYVPASQSLSPLERGLAAVTFQNSSVLSTLYTGPGALQEQACSSVLCFAPKHFLHNTLMSLLFLPTSPMLDDLWHITKELHPYWRADWDGTLAGTSLFFLAVNVLMIVLGAFVVWKQQRLMGMFPLAAFLVYNLSNSLARTSGGRYLVPMDWFLAIYFMAGALSLIAATARMTNLRKLSIFDPEDGEADNIQTAGMPWRKVIVAFAVLLVAGSLVPLSENIYPPRYAGFDIPAVLNERDSQIEEAGLDIEQVNSFLQTPGAEALVGRTLYPRSYKMGQGEVSFYFYPYTIMDFPRTGFLLIGPHGQDNILLPGGIPDHLPHATDVLVIGCREQNYVDALMVIVLDDSQAVHTRSPRPELACPMKMPVCDNNSNCQ